MRDWTPHPRRKYLPRQWFAHVAAEHDDDLPLVRVSLHCSDGRMCGLTLSKCLSANKRSDTASRPIVESTGLETHVCTAARLAAMQISSAESFALGRVAPRRRPIVTTDAEADAHQIRAGREDDVACASEKALDALAVALTKLADTFESCLE